MPDTYPSPTATTTVPDAPTGPLPRRTVLIISTLIAATFVVVMTETILNVALSTLMTELRIDTPTVQWLVTGYLLTMAVVILTTGSILQALSSRAAFVLAMGLFCTGAALATVAPGFALLLTARIIQAGGTAIMLPLLMTTILGLVPLTRRGKVIGYVSIALSVAPALGPAVSGLVLEHFSWRYLFVFVLPVALATLGVGSRVLTGRDANTPRTPRRTDVVSVVLTVPGFGGLVLGLSAFDAGGASSDRRWIAVAALMVGVLCLGLFTARQLRLQRKDTPLLDLRVFTERMFTLSVLLMFIATTALFAGAILLPLYLQDARGLSSLATGLALLPGGLALGLVAPLIGTLFDRIGPLPLTLAGSILTVAALGRLSLLTVSTPLPWVIATHIVLGLGLTLILTPTYAAGLNTLPATLHPHGSAIMSTAQQLAGAAGTALLVSVFASTAGERDVIAGTTAAFTAAAVLALTAVPLAALTRRGPRRTAG